MVINLIWKDDFYINFYVDFVKVISDIFDIYFWLVVEEVGNLKEIIEEIKVVVIVVVDEFDKVV